MKLGVLIIFLSAILGGCVQKKGCERFRNGKFYMYSPSSTEKIVIERNDSIQKETNIHTGITSKQRIEWPNDCEYRIVELASKRFLKDGVDSFFATLPINVAIISTGKDYYVFNIKVDSANKHAEYSDTVRVEK